MKRLMMLLLLLSCSAPLMGCAGWIVKPLPIDEALLSCANKPAVPGPGATNRQVAKYFTALRFAWDDCSSKLARMREVQAANR